MKVFDSQICILQLIVNLFTEDDDDEGKSEAEKAKTLELCMKVWQDLVGLGNSSLFPTFAF